MVCKKARDQLDRMDWTVCLKDTLSEVRFCLHQQCESSSRDYSSTKALVYARVKEALEAQPSQLKNMMLREVLFHRKYCIDFDAQCQSQLGGFSDLVYLYAFSKRNPAAAPLYTNLWQINPDDYDFVVNWTNETGRPHNEMLWGEKKQIINNFNSRKLVTLQKVLADPLLKHLYYAPCQKRIMYIDTTEHIDRDATTLENMKRTKAISRRTRRFTRWQRIVRLGTRTETRARATARTSNKNANRNIVKKVHRKCNDIIVVI